MSTLEGERFHQLPEIEAENLDDALLSALVCELARPEIRDQIPEVAATTAGEKVTVGFMQVDTDQGRIHVAAQWFRGEEGTPEAGAEDTAGTHRGVRLVTLLTTGGPGQGTQSIQHSEILEPTSAAMKTAGLGREARYFTSGHVAAALIRAIARRGVELPPDLLIAAEAQHIEVDYRSDHDRSITFVHQGRSWRVDVPGSALPEDAADRARSILSKPGIENLVPASEIAPRVTLQQLGDDLVVLTYNGRKAYGTHTELVLGPSLQPVEVHVAEGFRSTEQLQAEAKGLLAVSDEDARQVIGSNTFLATLTTLRTDLGRLDARFYNQGRLTDDQRLGITSVQINSVGRDSNGQVMTAMLSATVNSMNAKDELVPITQTFELRLHEDNTQLYVVDHKGERYIRVGRDRAGRPILPRPPQGEVGSGSYLVFSSIGSGNQRTRVNEVYENLDEPADLEDEGATWDSEAIAEGVSGLIRSGELLTIAQVVEQTDDLVTVAAVLSKADPAKDTDAIVAALKSRQAGDARKPAVVKRPPVIVIGKNLPPGTLDFEPFAEIVEQYPEAIGLVCSQITLSGQQKPFLAEVTGIVVKGPDSTETIRRIDPVLTREPSVTGGIFHRRRQDGRLTVVQVRELRMPVGSAVAEQTVAGSSGDQDRRTFPAIMHIESDEETGFDPGEILQLLAAYQAGPHTTERIELFAGLASTNTDVLNGRVGGVGPNERTEVTVLPLPNDAHDRIRLPVGRPRNAMTMVLAHLARIGAIERLS